MSAVVYGDRIRQARVLRHMTSADLSRLLGVAVSTVTRRETTPQVAMEKFQLHRLSNLLGFPDQFFLTPPTALVLDDNLLFRAPKSMPKREKTYLREFARVASEVLGWVDEKRPLPRLRLPVLRGVTDIPSAVQETRRSLGCDEGVPVRSVTHVIERAGVPVLRRSRADPLGDAPGTNTEKHLGYTTWVGDYWDRPIIVTRGIPSWERTRWTVAHEIGHAVLHQPGTPHDGETAERDASRFASEFLAPASVVRKELASTITLFSLLEIKVKWGISLGALISHLHTNELISNARRDTLRTQLYTRSNPETNTTYGVFEPGWKDRKPERPAMLRYWLERTVGTSQPNAIAAMSGVWPADLLREMLEEQREGTAPAPSSKGTAASSATVVDLASRRANP